MKNLILFVFLSLVLLGCNMNPSKEARIQELESEIEQAMERIDKLESANEQLESRIAEMESL